MPVFIRYAASVDSLGDATDAQRARFCQAATATLQRWYPGGDIEVTEAKHYGSSPLVYENVDPAEVRYVVNHVYESGAWLTA